MNYLRGNRWRMGARHCSGDPSLFQLKLHKNKATRKDTNRNGANLDITQNLTLVCAQANPINASAMIDASRFPTDP